MFRVRASRIGFALGLLALVLAPLSLSAQDKSITRSRKYKVPPPSSRIEVTVVRDADSKPIEAAAVIFHPMEGGRDRGSMELKTNEDGKAIIDVIPIGDVVRLQIIARGYQTYGQDYKIDDPSLAMEIRMKRPGGQYSIYKPHPVASNSGSGAKKSDKPSEQDSKQPDSSKPSQPQQ